MAASTSSYPKRLRRAGLIVGLASAALWIVLLFFMSEGGFSWYSVPNLVLVIPFLAGVLIAWKRPFAGSITLMVIVLYWLVSFTVRTFSTPTSQPILSLLLSHALRMLPIVLPPLAAGILFLLSWKAERTYSEKRGELMPRLRQAGVVIMALAGVFCFLYEVIHRSQTLGFSVIESLEAALVIGGSLILLAVAAWAWPLWGGVMGVGYSSLIIAYYVLTQSEGRTLLQLLGDFRFDIIPIIILLIGGIITLVSLRLKNN